MSVTPASLRRSKRVVHGLALIWIVLAVWLVNVNLSSDVAVPDVLADAMPIQEPQVAADGGAAFSLDARFVQSVASTPLYVLEQRAAPHHRVAELDPMTGELVTVWAIPDESLVHSIAQSPDGSYLAMAVTVDYRTPGNELVLLDLDDGETMSVWQGESGDHITDLAWSFDGSAVWATHVSGTLEGAEALSAIAIGVATGVVVDDIALAVNPAPLPDGVAFLDVDLADSARRSITTITGDGVNTVVLEDGTRDLDHLIYDPTTDGLLVAALVQPEMGVFGLGSPADAHGSHNVVSEWFTAQLSELLGSPPGGANLVSIDLTSTVVYDAVVTADGTLVFVTREGMSISSDRDAPVSVMASRAFRKVAG